MFDTLLQLYYKTISWPQISTLWKRIDILWGWISVLRTCYFYIVARINESIHSFSSVMSCLGRSTSHTHTFFCFDMCFFFFYMICTIFCIFCPVLLCPRDAAVTLFCAFWTCRCPLLMVQMRYREHKRARRVRLFFLPLLRCRPIQCSNRWWRIGLLHKVCFCAAGSVAFRKFGQEHANVRIKKKNQLAQTLSEE